MEYSVQILNGNEIIVQGAKEAGVDLYTGYPGSPLADFFNILERDKHALEENGAKVVIGNSEANAAAMASGAKMAGKNTLVAMKSMGLHVAADALSVGNFANPSKESKAGVVVVVGDDPWSFSTSTPADSRYLYKHLHMPFLMPSTPQELKDFISIAMKVSQESSVYIGVLLTTDMAEGGGRIKTGATLKRELSKIEYKTQHFGLSEHVMVPPNSLQADKTMLQERFPKAKKLLEEAGLCQVFGNQKAKRLIISAGACFETVKEYFEREALLEDVLLLKLGHVYPFPEKFVVPYLEGREIFVVEEKRDFIETELAKVMSQSHFNNSVWGKIFPDNGVGLPEFGGITLKEIQNSFDPIFDIKREKDVEDLQVPLRLPTFCPGCPHRETLSLLKLLRSELSAQGIDLVSHGDVGCYSLAFLPPFKEMHDLSAMGQGGALGGGSDIFTKNPSVVLMGDSTFYHSGMTSISNSVQMNHNITYILLDNGNTAMTGHQMTPTTGLNITGESRPKQNMLDVVGSLGVDQVIEVNPSDRYFYKNILKDFILKKGIKVIVSNKECALTFHGRKNREERLILRQGKSLPTKVQYQINQSSCEDCRECVVETGCPGLTSIGDAYGQKVAIDPQICVSDGYCTQIKACPSFEKVTLVDYQLPSQNLDQKDYSHLIEPDSISYDDIKKGKSYRIIISGVGGSGITTISKIFSSAAIEMEKVEGVGFKFFDQKGLAQRNGGVTGHVSFHPENSSMAIMTPLGQGDLVLSTDLLEGLRSLKFLLPNGRAIIDSDYQVPLSLMLDDKSLYELNKEEIKQKYGDRIFFYPFKKECEKLFGRSIYATSMVLGVSYQAGLIPQSVKEIELAIKNSVPKTEFTPNFQAFLRGRELFTKSDIHEQNDSFDISTIERDLQKFFLLPWNHQKAVSSFRNAFLEFERNFSNNKRISFGHYIYDIGIYRIDNIQDFVNSSKKLPSLYNGEFLGKALAQLARTYFVKDEITIAYHLSSPLKKSRDQKQYGHLAKKFYVEHINRPQVSLLGMKFEFDVHLPEIILRIFSKMTFLRKILFAHPKDEMINHRLREEILSGISSERLTKWSLVKGYRDVKYKRFEELNNESS